MQPSVSTQPSAATAPDTFRLLTVISPPQFVRTGRVEQEWACVSSFRPGM